jgi:hypothetical protein
VILVRSHFAEVLSVIAAMVYRYCFLLLLFCNSLAQARRISLELWWIPLAQGKHLAIAFLPAFRCD